MKDGKHPKYYFSEGQVKQAPGGGGRSFPCRQLRSRSVRRGPAGCGRQLPAATGARPVPSGPAPSRPVPSRPPPGPCAPPAKAGARRQRARTRGDFTPFTVEGLTLETLFTLPGETFRTVQAWSGYMHLFCWDHPGLKRLLRCSLTGVAGTELKSVGILHGMLLG